MSESAEVKVFYGYAWREHDAAPNGWDQSAYETLARAGQKHG